MKDIKSEPRMIKDETIYDASLEKNQLPTIEGNYFKRCLILLYSPLPLLWWQRGLPPSATRSLC
jgi:hypothetical protein